MEGAEQNDTTGAEQNDTTGAERASADAAPAAGSTAQQLKRNEKKWTPQLMRAGWTVFPSIILERQRALGLDAIDVNILMHLARHWWFQENPPFPSKKEMAECMKISESCVQRHIARLEKAGLIERVARKHKTYGQQTNAYKFDGLIEKAKPFAAEALAERDARKTEQAERRLRRKPKVPLRPRKGGA